MNLTKSGSIMTKQWHTVRDTQSNTDKRGFSLWSTVTIDLQLNCFEFACKNIIPLSFFYMRFSNTIQAPGTTEIAPTSFT